MARPKIFIVIVNYNSAKFIQSCLEGLKKQSFRDFKLIRELVNQARKLTKAGIIQSKILLYPSGQVQSLGNRISLLGFGYPFSLVLDIDKNEKFRYGDKHDWLCR